MSIEYFDKEALQKWFNDKGDETHRLNYNLNENSVVFDIGGYEGEWSEKIYNKFNSIIYIFEPVKKYYDLIAKKFKHNNKIKVFNFGISDKNFETHITEDAALSSLVIEGLKKEQVIIKNINDIIETFQVEEIDLMKINIEGSEYDLMTSISDNNIKKIKNFQIQFHKIGKNYNLKRESIRKKLSETHNLTYDYNFVWENWEKKY